MGKLKKLGKTMTRSWQKIKKQLMNERKQKIKKIGQKINKRK